MPQPVHFHRRDLAGTLVVASDGLFDHAPSDAIRSACVGDPRAIADRLVKLPELHSGALPDDISAIVVRAG